MTSPQPIDTVPVPQPFDIVPEPQPFDTAPEQFSEDPYDRFLPPFVDEFDRFRPGVYDEFEEGMIPFSEDDVLGEYPRRVSFEDEMWPHDEGRRWVFDGDRWVPYDQDVDLWPPYDRNEDLDHTDEGSPHAHFVDDVMRSDDTSTDQTSTSDGTSSSSSTPSFDII